MVVSPFNSEVRLMYVLLGVDAGVDKRADPFIVVVSHAKMIVFGSAGNFLSEIDIPFEIISLLIHVHGRSRFDYDAFGELLDLRYFVFVETFARSFIGN